MRDVVILCAVLGILPFACRHTWIGVLLWTWISIMNPHKLAWGFAQDMPFAAMAAGATAISLFLTKDKVRIPWYPAVVCLVLLTLWMCMTTAMAINPEDSVRDLVRTLKIQVMTLIALAAIRERKHIEWFVWVNALSLGFYGLKGGVFTFVNNGSERVWGPPGGFIEGNNEIGLAFVMAIPLMNYLRMVSANRWVRLGLLGLMLATAIAVLGTQSRGAFLAIVAMGIVMWARSQRKAMSAVAIGLIGLALTAFMPESWDERMSTIGTYEQDGSAMGRINAWQMAFHLANARPIGGGFSIYTGDIFAKYAPVPEDVHAAHSIYFQILGEHGYLGLFLFLLVGFYSFVMASRIRRECRDNLDLAWLYHLSGMAQVSMVGFAVGGAFLSLAYFDLPYNIMVILVAGMRLVLEKKGAQKGAFGAGAPVADLRRRPRPRRALS